MKEGKSDKAYVLSNQVHDQHRAKLCNTLSSMSESLFTAFCMKLKGESGTLDYDGLRANLALFAVHELVLGRLDIVSPEDEHRKDD